MSDPRPDALDILPTRPPRQAMGDGGLRLAAPAKINLDLYVGPRRPDGYHPLDSLVAKVALYDEIILHPRPDGRIAFRCDGAECGSDDKNLALRAARLLAEHARPHGGDHSGVAPREAGADIVLTKSIPPGKGLGGGSSDAAAVLAGLNELWALHLPAARLAELAAALGSDVPLFLGPPVARMTGRGERLASAAVHEFLAVLHMPPAVCPTAQVYRCFDELAGQRPGPADLPPGGPFAAPPRDLHALLHSPPGAWRGSLRNDLAVPAFYVSPDLRRTHEAMLSALGRPVSVTGSGSGLFVLCDDPAEAAEVLRRLPAALPGRTVCVRPNPW
jgi:4-diphosphocytidyl-2-C-methyl-D-erythritol kinase